jgi:tyrosine-protein kinase Etk/Wzc
LTVLTDTPPRPDTGQNLRLLWSKVKRYWYLFAISLLIAAGVAYWYLKVTIPLYQVEAQVLIKDEKSYGEDILFAELGLGKKIKNIENEVLVLLSSPLMADVVFKNSLQWRYFRDEGPVLREIYIDPPIRILDWSPATSRGRVTGEVIPDGLGGYRFVVGAKEYTGEFGGQLILPEGKLILWSDRSIGAGESLIVMALSVEEMVGYFQENLDVSIAGEESSILLLKLKDPSPNRAHDVLMGLIDAYNEQSIDDKNKGYEGAIRLIDERLAVVTSELSEVEKDVEAFKSKNVTVELGAEASLLMSEMAGYDHKISDMGVQMEVMDEIEGVLTKNIDGQQFLPTNLSINNVALGNELQSFNTLLAQREQQLRKLGPDHPDLQLLSKQIDNLRGSIKENLNTLRSELHMMQGANKQQQQILQNRTRSLPRRERQLVEKERRKSVVENLYLYLLQKREESTISMAVTTSTGSVVEPADIPEVPVSPKGSQVWLIAFFLGMAAPTALTLLIMNLNDRVEDATSIHKVTGVPVLASIANSRSKENMVMHASSNSVVAEMFRLLRADLMYLTPGEDLHTLLITSSCSGEGKSFISMNLGMTMALSGKRVLILELDLRKPKHERYFELGTVTTGVVNYLVDQNVRAEDIIVNSGLHPGLDVILSGPIPPNPGELILSRRLRGLILDLRKTYDTIILDTPPVGLVADALQLKDLPQATMYVVRAGYTRLPQLKVIEEIRTRQKLPKPFIVLNGVRFDGAGTYGYGYGYFGENEDPGGIRGWWQRLMGGRGSSKIGQKDGKGVK